jgi:hypothetical protein
LEAYKKENPGSAFHRVQNNTSDSPESVSQIQPWQHPHQGNKLGNCEQCGMPLGARQHIIQDENGEWRLIEEIMVTE